MKNKLTPALILLVLALSACAPQAVQTPLAAESQPMPLATVESESAAVGFSEDVLPIFVESCNDCHGAKQTKAGLDLTTYESLMAGSSNGAVILAGNSAESILVQQVVDGEMPKRGDKLTPEQIQIIRQWVDAGASND